VVLEILVVAVVAAVVVDEVVAGQKIEMAQQVVGLYRLSDSSWHNPQA
jgi:hypothetical protein